MRKTLLIPLIAATIALSTTSLSAANRSLTFAREVIVDQQRVDGEPSIAIDTQDRIYVSAPYGFSTTASFVWRSTDHGMSFHLVPGNLPPLGKPLVTCPGGGDSGLALDSVNRVYFVDLQGLTDISNSVSSDQATNWNTTCNAANETGVDRPWIATFGNPASGGNLYQTVDDTEQCIGACEPDLGQVGSNVVEITHSNDGVTFAPVPGQQIEPDGIVGGIITDANGGVYIAHTGLTDANGNLIGGSDSNGNDNAVMVVRFPNGYNATTSVPLTNGQTLCQMSPSTCTTTVVYHAPLNASGNSTVSVGQDFAPIAVDRAGNLYVVWAQSSVDASSGLVNGRTGIYLAVSSDHGAHWGAPVSVSATAPSLQTNLFAWVAAGDSGRVDVVWYGTPTLGACPSQPCGSSAITAHWSVMMAQTLNAVTHGRPNPTPSFAVTQVSEVSNHYGAICTMGIGCTTGGDRGLLDFLSITVGHQGEANVVWADAVNNNANGGEASAVIAFSRQVAGPSLYTSVGQVNGAPPANGSAPGSPDAFYSANGEVVQASANLMLKSASAVKSDPQHYTFTINVNDLSTLAVSPTLGGTDAVWLVRWEVPDPNGAGHTYFAAMESDAGGTPTYYDGETSSINSDHGKLLVYPPGHTIQGRYQETSSGGVVTLVVPISDVGGNGSATLYSLTGLTVTQTTPGSTDAIFNQIDATGAFDMRP